jgi:hypothetical protein
MPPKQKVILEYVNAHPNQTAAEIARGLFGHGIKQQAVYSDLQLLWRAGHVEKFTAPDKKGDRYAVPAGVPAGVSLITPKDCQAKQSKAARSALDRETLKRELGTAAEVVIRRLLENENDRMHSWEHCFEYFHRFRRNVTDETADLAALHLGFYLASYGMYRGSSLLLKRDYRFLIPIVKELTKPSYVASGMSPNLVEQATDAGRAVRLWKCCESLSAFLVRNGFENNPPSGTLITKILLGTWCNVPAFDRVFKDAVKATGFGTAAYNRKNFESVFAALRCHSDIFQNLVGKFHTAGLKNYPTMRVIDAVLWQFAGGDKKLEQGEI